MSSHTWKNLERETAKALGGTRVLRGFDFSHSDVDVALPEWPELKLDCKYKQKHAHHSLYYEIRRKYCKEKGSIPVLVTKVARERGMLVTISMDFFRELLDGRKRHGTVEIGDNGLPVAEFDADGLKALGFEIPDEQPIR